MFKKLKRASAVSRLLDEQLYAQVVAELSAGERRDGLWGKALAHSDGTDDKARGLYIKYRVQSLKDESVVTAALEEIESTKVKEQIASDESGEQVAFDDSGEQIASDDSKEQKTPYNYPWAIGFLVAICLFYYWRANS